MELRRVKLDLGEREERNISKNFIFNRIGKEKDNGMYGFFQFYVIGIF